MKNSAIHTGALRNMSSVYIRRNDQLLLLYRQGNSIVNNLWIGSAGGHFEKEELNDAKACVLRELFEELALTEADICNLSLRYITLRYTGDEIMYNYYFFADLSSDSISTPNSNEGHTQWFSIHTIKDLPMPITAQHMLEHYLKFGQYNSNLYVGISDTVKTEFLILKNRHS